MLGCGLEIANSYAGCTLTPQNQIAMLNAMSKIEELQLLSRELNRQIVVMQHCLKLGLLHYDKGNEKQGDYYLNLSDQYYTELKGFCERGCSDLPRIRKELSTFEGAF
jgi:hypothetical protein